MSLVHSGVNEGDKHKKSLLEQAFFKDDQV